MELHISFSTDNADRFGRRLRDAKLAGGFTLALLVIPAALLIAEILSKRDSEYYLILPFPAVSLLVGAMWLYGPFRKIRQIAKGFDSQSSVSMRLDAATREILVLSKLG